MSDPSSLSTGNALEASAAHQAADVAHLDDSNVKQNKPRSLWGDAWLELRTKPLFIISLVLILFILLISAFPSLFSSANPDIGVLTNARNPPSGSAWFGYDTQGRDVFARVMHGARASVIVGIASTLLTVIFGGLMGLLAGYFGGWLDALMSRIADIFFGIPFVLGAIVILTTLNPPSQSPGQFQIITQVVLSISLLSWPMAMRIMRSAAISAKQQDYVKAARSLGASTPRIVFKHLLPNSVAPLLVFSTIALGANIGAEATLAFLGVGLRPPVISWGVMISDSTQYVQAAPHMLLFPAAFVTVTVLAFVMLGDAVRDALDPKSR
jgi:oligopeptide transport system permease protein